MRFVRTGRGNIWSAIGSVIGLHDEGAGHSQIFNAMRFVFPIESRSVTAPKIKGLVIG
jgi:hypothetical protein